MAGPAPTTLTNQEDRSAGPVHSSGWLSRRRAARVRHMTALWAAIRRRTQIIAAGGATASFMSPAATDRQLKSSQWRNGKEQCDEPKRQAHVATAQTHLPYRFGGGPNACNPL